MTCGERKVLTAQARMLRKQCPTTYMLTPDMKDELEKEANDKWEERLQIDESNRRVIEHTAQLERAARVRRLVFYGLFSIFVAFPVLLWGLDFGLKELSWPAYRDAVELLQRGDPERAKYVLYYTTEHIHFGNAMKPEAIRDELAC